MKKIILLFLLATLSIQAQNEGKFNTGFEVQSYKDSLSDGWRKWGSYDLVMDTLAYSGKMSGKIVSDKGGSAFGSIAYRIPAKNKGQSIQLEGFMKIRNVENGFAGLLLRIDGNGNSLAFDNMQDQKISGTKDWQKYSITLDYPEDAEDIFIAGILVGKGEAWFDEFALSIDGENVETLEEVEEDLAVAQLDKEFDNGSQITLSDLTPEEIEDLELLGRVWGFLKYHHPEIAKGNYNWDYELFRCLPSYLAAESERERDEFIIAWIDSLGKIEACETCRPTAENAVLKPDLEWIENQSEPLRKKLFHTYENRSQGKHYYVRMMPGVGNPEFRHENAYASMPYPDDGFRLLSLFRYWNMINYFFPNRHLTDKDWNLSLREYIPVFLNAKNELEYELAALQLIGEIQDTHANLWGGADRINEWKGEYYPPVHVRFLGNQLVVTDHYNPELQEAAGLEPGDVITRINGKTTAELVKERSGYYPASNVPTRLRDISADILRSDSRQIEIGYLSGDSEEKTARLKLYPADSLNRYRGHRKSEGRSFRMLDNNIGYVTLENIKEEDIPEIKKVFKDTRGIIIDIRNYPATFVPFSLGSWFVSASTPFVKFTNGNTDNPGEFTFTESLEIPAEGETYRGKLVVLVNELSQSQAEYTAMAFRAGDNTTIVGSTTAGADGNVSGILLPGGLRTMISGIGVYYPDGEETQRVGIIPDVEVNPTIEGIREAKDELVEKAVEVILKE